MRVNLSFNLTAGTPINIGARIAGDQGAPLWADRVFIQMAKGGTGVGYVGDGIPVGTTPAAKLGGAGQLTAQLQAATAAAPGGSYSDRASERDGGGIDLRQLWIDGDQNDPVLVSVSRRI